MYDHLDVYLNPMTLTFNLLENVSNGTSPPQGQQLCKIILKSVHKWVGGCINVQDMARTRSIHVYHYFDLYLTPATLTFKLPKMFQKALLLLEGNNCATLF